MSDLACSRQWTADETVTNYRLGLPKTLNPCLMCMKGELHGVCGWIWSWPRSAGSDFRCHDSLRIPRLAIDLIDPRRRRLQSIACPAGQRHVDEGLSRREIPFPDGAIIVALHWKRVASDEDNKVFGTAQAFVAGPRVNMQIMVKDSKKYAATGGWGFWGLYGRQAG